MRVDGDAAWLLGFLGSCWAFFEVSLMEIEADNLHTLFQYEDLR